MKTVFLFLRQGISNRNLLRTEFLKTLKLQPGVRTVIISPIGDQPEFRKELESPNVCVEKWPRTKVRFVEKRLKNLKDYVWVNRGLTQAIRVRRLAQRGEWGLAWRDAVGRMARRLGANEERINQLEMQLYRSQPALASLYEQYKPDLAVFTRVFGTNMHMVKEAKLRGVKVLCLVESWDNFICKGPLSVVPDSMAVWNETMIDEAAALHFFPRENVEVVGVPQFDIYANPAQFIGRQEFFASHGLDPQRKLITYAASTEGIARDEPKIVETLYEKVTETLGQSAQLLVRLHPITSPALQQEYFSRFGNRPKIVIQQPGRRSALHDGWDPSWSDMLMLHATIRYSDVIVNVASTMTIDAAALDKPVICVGYEKKGAVLETDKLKAIFYKSHYLKLVETNAFRLVFDDRELVDALSGYLDDPTRDALGRRILRERLCYRLDGRSGWRAAQLILRRLGMGEQNNPEPLKVGRTEADRLAV